MLLIMLQQGVDVYDVDGCGCFAALGTITAEALAQHYWITSVDRYE